MFSQSGGSVVKSDVLIDFLHDVVVVVGQSTGQRYPLGWLKRIAVDEHTVATHTTEYQR